MELIGVQQFKDQLLDLLVGELLQDFGAIEFKDFGDNQWEATDKRMH
jgi:hypothetical protein